MPAVTSELFGLENFATNYAIIMLGPAAGAARTGTALRSSHNAIAIARVVVICCP